MSKVKSNRLRNEHKKMHRDKMELENSSRIFFNWDGENMQKATALIVGPEDTPYEDGFFFFEVTFPDNYPTVSPKVHFKTTDGRCRLHPNLYVEGKVCLSILGTWQGPSWTMSMTFNTVLLTIQSLLHQSPLTNEPGYESRKGSEIDKTYDKLITYEAAHIAIYRMLKFTPPAFAHFLPQMKRAFLDNYDRIIKRVDKYAPDEGKVVQCRVYNFPTTYAPGWLKSELAILKREIEKEDGDPELVVPKKATEAQPETKKCQEAETNGASSGISSSSVTVDINKSTGAENVSSISSSKRNAPTESLDGSSLKKVKK